MKALKSTEKQLSLKKVMINSAFRREELLYCWFSSATETEDSNPEAEGFTKMQCYSSNSHEVTLVKMARGCFFCCCLPADKPRMFEQPAGSSVMIWLADVMLFN